MNTLAESIKINGRVIKNRVVLPPMSLLGAAEDGTATEKMAQGYEAFAKGGFGMIVTEGLYIDEKYSKGAPKQPGFVTDQQMESWKPIIEKVHGNGAVMIAQLAHIGAFGRGENGTVAPSAIPFHPEMPVPKELTKDEIGEIVRAFGTAAKNAMATGFDGIEIHGAMGLVQQFLSGMTNHRIDEYGGTLENKMRFLLEIVKEVRNQTSPEFIVGVRVLEDETLNLENFEKLYHMLGQQEIDYIHTSEKDALKKTAVTGEDSFSSLVKKYSGKITIAAGGLGNKENALEAGQNADMISIGKAALANPNWVHANM